MDGSVLIVIEIGLFSQSGHMMTIMALFRRVKNFSGWLVRGAVYHFFEEKKFFFKYIFKKISNTFCRTSQNLTTVT